MYMDSKKDIHNMTSKENVGRKCVDTSFYCVYLCTCVWTYMLNMKRNTHIIHRFYLWVEGFRMIYILCSCLFAYCEIQYYAIKPSLHFRYIKLQKSQIINIRTYSQCVAKLGVQPQAHSLLTFLYFLLNSLGPASGMSISLSFWLSIKHWMVIRVTSSCLKVLPGCTGKKENHAMIILGVGWVKQNLTLHVHVLKLK